MTEPMVRPAVRRDASSTLPDPHDRAILVVLRELGATSPDTLAERMGASPARIRQRLRLLEGAGLVLRQSVRHGVGRPRHLYDVTPSAQPALPGNYDGLAETLLRSIRTIGGEELVDQVFQARRRILSERIRSRFEQRLAPDASLEERTRELAALQDENGYLCRATALDGSGGPIELRQANCAIISAAAGHPSACSAELQLISEVLGANVERVTHIASGDRACTYVIRPTES
jgi:predicted ArsR family transcriptional regulator